VGGVRSHLQFLEVPEVEQQGHHAYERRLACKVAQPQPSQPCARACRCDERKGRVRLFGHAQGQPDKVDIATQIVEEGEKGILDG
jgi:hypothetical protein